MANGETLGTLAEFLQSLGEIGPGKAGVEALETAFTKLETSMANAQGVLGRLGFKNLTADIMSLQGGLEALPAVIRNVDAAFAVLPRHSESFKGLTDATGAFGTSLQAAGDDVIQVLTKMGALKGMSADMAKNYLEAADHGNQLRVAQVALAAATGRTSEFFNEEGEVVGSLDGVTRNYITNIEDAADAQGMLMRELAPVNAELAKIPGTQHEMINLGGEFETSQLRMVASLGQAYGQDPKSFVNVLSQYHRTLGITGQEANVVFGSMGNAAGDAEIPMEMLLGRTKGLTDSFMLMGGGIGDAFEAMVAFKKAIPDLSPEAAAQFGEALQKGIGGLDITNLDKMMGMLGRPATELDKLKMRQQLTDPTGAGRLEFASEMQADFEKRFGPMLSQEDALAGGETGARQYRTQLEFTREVAKILGITGALQVETLQDAFASDNLSEALAQSADKMEAGGDKAKMREDAERGIKTAAEITTAATMAARQAEKEYYRVAMEANKNLREASQKLDTGATRLLTGLERTGELAYPGAKGSKDVEGSFAAVSEKQFNELSGINKGIESLVNLFTPKGQGEETETVAPTQGRTARRGRRPTFPTAPTEEESAAFREALERSILEGQQAAQTTYGVAPVGPGGGGGPGNAIVQALQSLEAQLQKPLTGTITVNISDGMRNIASEEADVAVERGRAQQVRNSNSLPTQ